MLRRIVELTALLFEAGGTFAMSVGAMSDGAPTPPPPSTSDRLAHERTELAGDRTVMAADRTLMAWIRTALAMISFGFTIYKFLHVFAESGTFHLRRPNGPRDLGLF